MLEEDQQWVGMRKLENNHLNLQLISSRKTLNFKNDKVEVFDTRGTGDHFSLVVISDKFIDVSLVERHRMIYAIFEDKIVTEIHALQIQAYTIAEWKKKKISN